jgi:hypothetical protein
MIYIESGTTLYIQNQQFSVEKKGELLIPPLKKGLACF